jgi:outer membrane protein OmpA-like peptidoglycan-associated protein
LARLIAVLLAAALAAGCASRPVSPALFVVLPAPDGHIGAIAVERDCERQVIDTAYGSQQLGADGSLKPGRLSEAEVRTRFGSTLDALPAAPAMFTLYFLEGSDELTPGSKDDLEHVFGEIGRRPLPDIVVIGHTDTIGGSAYNDRLSLARAERMRELLVARGVPANRIQVRGRGERELLVPTEDEVREPRNRRVEINVR